MKLRLPQTLRTALAAVFTASLPLATTVATGTLILGSPYAWAEEGDEGDAQEQEDAVTLPAISAYAGTIYTWNGVYRGSDVAYGKFIRTSYNAATGSFTVDEGSVLQRWNGNENSQYQSTGDDETLLTINVLANNGAYDRTSTDAGVTLRFSGSYGTGQKAPVFTFDPLIIGGLIVESDAVGYSITSSDSKRHIRMGASSTQTAYSLIKADFTLDNTSDAGNVLELRGTQTIVFDNAATLKLNSKKAEIYGALTLDGKGTLAFTNTATAATIKAGTSISLNQKAGLTFAQNLDIELTGRTSSDDPVLTLNGSGNVSVAGNMTLDLTKHATGNKALLAFNGSGDLLVTGTLSLGDINTIYNGTYKLAELGEGVTGNTFTTRLKTAIEGVTSTHHRNISHVTSDGCLKLVIADEAEILIDSTPTSKWDVTLDKHDTSLVTVTGDGTTLTIGSGANTNYAGQGFKYGQSITVQDGGTLNLWSWGTGTATKKTLSLTDKVIIDSQIILKDGGHLKTTDGSYYFRAGLKVDGDADISHGYGKGLVYGAINNGQNTTATTTLTFKGNTGETGVTVFSAEGDFSGIVALQKGNDQSYVLNHGKALKNAVVDIGAGTSLMLNVATADIAGLTGTGKILLNGTNWEVAEADALTASTLTITGHGEDILAFSGTIDSGVSISVADGVTQNFENITMLGGSSLDLGTTGVLTGVLTLDVQGDSSAPPVTLTTGSRLELTAITLVDRARLLPGTYQLMDLGSLAAARNASELLQIESEENGCYYTVQVTADGKLNLVITEQSDIVVDSTKTWDVWADLHEEATVTITGSGTELTVGSGGQHSDYAGESFKYGAPVIVEDGASLIFHSWTNKVLTAAPAQEDKVVIASDIVLKGGSTLKTEDGSYHFTGEIQVDGNAKIVNNWNKGNIFGAINGGGNATENTTLLFTQADGYDNNSNGDAIVVFSAAGDFPGTVTLRKNKWIKFIFTHGQAFQNAVVNLDNSAELRFGVSTVSIAGLKGSGSLQLNGNNYGITGAPTSATLTITGHDTADSAENAMVFTGTIGNGITVNVGDGVYQGFRNLTMGNGAKMTLGNKSSLAGTLTLDATGVSTTPVISTTGTQAITSLTINNLTSAAGVCTVLQMATEADAQAVASIGGNTYTSFDAVLSTIADGRYVKAQVGNLVSVNTTINLGPISITNNNKAYSGAYNSTTRAATLTFTEDTSLNLAFSTNDAKSFTAEKGGTAEGDVTVTLNSLTFSNNGAVTISGSEHAKVTGSFGEWKLEGFNYTLGRNVSLTYNGRLEVGNDKRITLNTGSSIQTTDFRLTTSANKTGTVVIDGGTLKITGSNNYHSDYTTGKNVSFALSHFNARGTLELKGGKLDASDAVMFLSWDGSGTYTQSGGEAWVKGISAQKRHNESADAGSYVTLSGGTLHLGGEGLQYIVNSGTNSATNNFKLGNVTIIAEENWSTSGGSGSIALTATGDNATTINTKTNNVTFNHALVRRTDEAQTADGNLVKTGAGMLTFKENAAAAVSLNQGVLTLTSGKSLTSVTTGGTGLVLNANGANIGAATIKAGHDLTVNGALNTSSLSLEATGTLKLVTGSSVSIASGGSVSLAGTIDMSDYMPTAGTMAIVATGATPHLENTLRILLNTDVAVTTLQNTDVSQTGLLGSTVKWYVSDSLGITDKTVFVVDGTRVAADNESFTWEDGVLTSSSFVYNIAANDTTAQAEAAYGNAQGKDRSGVLFQQNAVLNGVTDEAIPGTAFSTAADTGSATGRVTGAKVVLGGEYTVTASNFTNFVGGTVEVGDGSTLVLGADYSETYVASLGSINFTGGTLSMKASSIDTPGLFRKITGDVKIDIGGNSLHLSTLPGSSKVEFIGTGSGMVELNGTSQPSTLNDLVVSGGTIKVGDVRALKNVNIKNGAKNVDINTIATNITLTGGTLEFNNGNTSSLAASVLARWTYMISGKVTAELADGVNAYINMGSDSGISTGIGLANTEALTYKATNNGGTLYINSDITGFGNMRTADTNEYSTTRKFTIAKSSKAANGVEVVINGELGNNGAASTDSCGIIIDKLGDGTLKIANANYTPQLKIEEGTVIAAHGQALGKERDIKNVVTVGTDAVTTGVKTAKLDLQVSNTTAIQQLLGNAQGIITNSLTGSSNTTTLTVGSSTSGVGASSFAGRITGNLNLKVAANTLTLTGASNDYTGSTTVASSAYLKLQGAGAIDNGVVSISVTSDEEDAVVSLSDVTIGKDGSGVMSISTSGTSTSISGATIGVAGTLKVGSGVALSDATVSVASTGSISLLEGSSFGGSLSVAGEASIGTGISLTNTAISVDATGSLSLAAGVTLGSGVTLSNNGSISLDGVAINTGMLRTVEGTDYSEGNGNGFLSNVQSIFAAGSTGSVTSGSTVTIDGNSYDVSANGTIVYSTETGDTFYVHDGVIVYDADSSSHEASIIELTGGTLQMDTGLAEGTTIRLSSASGSTIELAEGVTLDSSKVSGMGASRILTLDGSGTYQLNAATSTTFGPGTTVASTWTGEVAIYAPWADSPSVEYHTTILNENSSLRITNDPDNTPGTKSLSALIIKRGTVIFDGVGDFSVGTLALGNSGSVAGRTLRLVNGSNMSVALGASSGLATMSGALISVDSSSALKLSDFAISGRAEGVVAEVTFSDSLTSGTWITAAQLDKLSISNAGITYTGSGDATLNSAITNSDVTVSSGTLTISNDGINQSTIGTLTVNSNTKIDGWVNASSVSIAKSKEITVANGSHFTANNFKFESNRTGDGTITAGSAGNSGGELRMNSDVVFANMTVTLTGVTTVTENGVEKDATFYAGVDNVDFVHDHSGTTKMDLSWRTNRDFSSLFVKQGSIEFSTADNRSQTINVAGTGNVTLNAGSEITLKQTVQTGQTHPGYNTLVMESGVLTIASSDDSDAVISSTSNGSTLAGADATAKVGGATVTIDNTADGTSKALYTWGAQLEGSSLTTSGNVKLTNTETNTVSGLTVERDTLTLAGNLQTTGNTTVKGTLDIQSDNVVLGRTTAKTTLGSGSDDSNGSITIASGKTLSIVNSEISHIAFATETGSSTVDITAGGVMAAGDGRVVTAGATPSTSALMADCSLKNTDVVITASGAIDTAARALGVENFYNKEFTLNILSGVSIDANSTLKLIGMDNYRDIVLHWSVSGEPETTGPARLASEANDGVPANVREYTGGAVNLYDLTGATRGQVVNVWATYTVPEPTTGALSVLALAALAARRRRRGNGK